MSNNGNENGRKQKKHRVEMTNVRSYYWDPFVRVALGLVFVKTQGIINAYILAFVLFSVMYKMGLRQEGYISKSMYE